MRTRDDIPLQDLAPGAEADLVKGGREATGYDSEVEVTEDLAVGDRSAEGVLGGRKNGTITLLDYTGD